DPEDWARGVNRKPEGVFFAKPLAVVDVELSESSLPRQDDVNVEKEEARTEGLCGDEELGISVDGFKRRALPLYPRNRLECGDRVAHSHYSRLYLPSMTRPERFRALQPFVDER